ncbi:MAG: MBOAT family protein [bacterium]|nr:MBOAT family protein [bacterium]
MVFSSVIFLFFFLPLTFLLYFLSPKNLRNLFLLASSLIFYAWGEGLFVLIMLVSIAGNYVAGLLVDRFNKSTHKKLILTGAIFFNLAFLSLYKYGNFITDNLNVLFSVFHMNPVIIDPLHLPIGISFFTFQAMSYVIDVYRKEAPVQKNPLNIGLYIALFPQLIAGPIIRYHDVAKQIVHRTVNRKKFAEGVERFVLGLGKKVLIANQMGLIADQVFSQTSAGLSTGTAWIGLLCYTFQIYFDFSGYSDMAIGLGRMFGFRFLENFNYPYISQSVQEFWRRWHISLSNWFRDYLYIPLGGNRKGPMRTYVNLVIVFLLCGLWHGASWNFVIWGLWHGLFLAVERVGLSAYIKRIWFPFRHVYLLFVVMIGWVFFRSETLSSSLSYISALFGLSGKNATVHQINVDSHTTVVIVAAIVFSMPIFKVCGDLKDKVLSHTEGFQVSLFNGAAVLSKVLIIYTVLYSSILCLSAGVYNPFIYFRF